VNVLNQCELGAQQFDIV